MIIYRFLTLFARTIVLSQTKSLNVLNLRCAKAYRAVTLPPDYGKTKTVGQYSQTVGEMNSVVHLGNKDALHTGGTHIS